MRIEWPFDDLPRAQFAAIAADPPWRFRTRSQKGEGRAPSYDLMDTGDIAALPVADLAAPDAFLFLWATGPHLPQALDVMRAWGFAYSATAFVWIKQRRAHEARQLRFLPNDEADLHLGCGYTTRKNAEFCLLGRRGKPRRLAADVREVILSPVREHSRKPDEFFARVERFCAGPRVELFARQKRPGWQCWGNQIGFFNQAA